MPVGADSPVPPQRLLLVEDDDDLRAYLARLLTRDGWVVTAAADVDAAEALIGQMAFELVLTDLLLPGRNGLELVTALRGRQDTARLPIIVLTANSAAAAVQGLTPGADDYLTKPFPRRELLARVRAHHQVHQLRERAAEHAHAKAEQICGALNTSRAIGTALGVLVAAYQLTSAQGFQLLVAASQHSNRKLRDIADEVVDTENSRSDPPISTCFCFESSRSGSLALGRCCPGSRRMAPWCHVKRAEHQGPQETEQEVLRPAGKAKVSDPG